MPTKAQTIGDNLRAMRARTRMSQETLAECIGVHVNTIARWEAGKNSLPFDMACQLADLFGCPLDELAGRSRK